MCKYFTGSTLPLCPGQQPRSAGASSAERNSAPGWCGCIVVQAGAADAYNVRASTNLPVRTIGERLACGAGQQDGEPAGDPE